MRTTTTRIDSPTTDRADRLAETGRAGSYEAVVAELATGLALECATCTGLICLDCAEQVPHARCTRPCQDCAGHDDDLAQDWKLDSLLTELGGLSRLDAAIAALPQD